MTVTNNPDVKKQASEEMKLMHMIHGSRITQLIYVAAKLKISDLLDEGPKSSREIAQMVGRPLPCSLSCNEGSIKFGNIQ